MPPLPLSAVVTVKGASEVSKLKNTSGWRDRLVGKGPCHKILATPVPQGPQKKFKYWNPQADGENHTTKVLHFYMQNYTYASSIQTNALIKIKHYNPFTQ